MNDLILLDTNILIYLLKGDEKIISILEERVPVISVITEIELLSFPNTKPSELSSIKKLIADCQVVSLNKSVKKEAIELRKQFKLKTVDSIVAATAKFLNLPLITADKSFAKLDKALSQILIYKP
ncbi:MAG: type II toxin-antitoxin system VapC family toxin [Chitinophagales bacterium]|nr:type II toxin-antitoxin system VapC family toxin [Chitinophagales bacterium]